MLNTDKSFCRHQPHQLIVQGSLEYMFAKHEGTNQELSKSDFNNANCRARKLLDDSAPWEDLVTTFDMKGEGYGIVVDAERSYKRGGQTEDEDNAVRGNDRATTDTASMYWCIGCGYRANSYKEGSSCY